MNLRMHSKNNMQLRNLYYGFIVGVIVLSVAAAGCLYAIFLKDLPVPMSIIFFLGFLLFAKQSLDGGRSLKLLSRFVSEATVNDGIIEIRTISSGSASYKITNDIYVRIIDRYNNLLKRIIPAECVLIEIGVENKKYMMSLSNEEHVKLRAAFDQRSTRSMGSD